MLPQTECEQGHNKRLDQLLMEVRIGVALEEG
jgi:hypothetical protein